MDCKLITLINEDFNEILQIKDIWDIDKYTKRFNTCLKCSDKLKKLLYEETDYCLKIFNNHVKDIMENYINHKINYQELEAFLNCTFKSKNTIQKEKYNEIFPEFIRLLIDNIDILNEERAKNIVVKPKPACSNKYDSESDTESKLKVECETELASCLKQDLDSDLILSKYPNLRKNQIMGLSNTIQEGFITGCHNHIMGSGKTIMELIHIDAHCNFILDKNLINGSIYMFVSSRINILKDIFFNNGKREEYKKYGFDVEKYKIIDLVNGNFLDKKNKLSESKPNIIACNIQYLQALLTDTDNFKIIINKLKLIIFDESHNISAPNTYKFMKLVKTKNIPIIGFSATPTRTQLKAQTYFKDIFSIENKPNVISTYDLFQGIADSCILPFVVKQYELKGIYKAKSLDNYDNDDDTEKTDNSDELSYQIEDFDYNEALIKKAVLDEMKACPYVKIVGWCSSIKNAIKWKEFFENEIPELTVYITHSGNADYACINEYDDFYKLQPVIFNEKVSKKVNAILLCVGRVSEGCDIDYVDLGIFLDPVKNKNVVNYLQCAGRISRVDKLELKDKAIIIVPYIGSVDIIKRLIAYYKTLLQLSERDSEYYEKISELFKRTKLVDKKQIRIGVDNNQSHDCILHFDKSVDDWQGVREKLKKVIDVKYGVRTVDLDIRKTLKQYSYTSSTILSCKMNNIINEKNKYKPIIYDLYLLINDTDKIMKYKTINIIRGEKNDFGFCYYPKLNISYQGYCAFDSLFEIISQCKFNNIKLEMSIRLKNDKIFTIEINNGKVDLNIDDIVTIKNIEYLKNGKNIYKFENNVKGDLYGTINKEAGKVKVLY